MIEALTTKPNVLDVDSALRTATLVVASFEAAGGVGDAGYRAGAAMELLTTALHLFDGITDHDRASQPSDMLVGVALHSLASHVLDSSRVLGKAVDWSPVHSLMTTVGAGQQKDIDLQRQDSPSLEDAKAMTIEKTGAYGEAMALAGALAAGAPEDLRRELALLGQYLGMAGQLLDDAADASPAHPETSDVSLKKKSLPIAFFLQEADKQPDWSALREVFLKAGSLTEQDQMAVRRAVEACGGIEFTEILACWYKMKALTIIDRLQARGCETRLLRTYL